MKINKLSLTNFRCFESCDISFHPNFNIFIGDNATGKTAILEALTAAIGPFFIGFEGSSARNIQSDDIRLKFFEHGGIVTYEHQVPVRIQCLGSSNGATLDWRLTQRYPKGQTDRKDARGFIDHSAQLSEKVRNGAEVTLPLIAYYGTGRLWRSRKNETAYPEPGSSRFEGYRQCIAASSDVRMFKAWWKEQEMIGLQEKETAQLKAVKKAIARAIPEAEKIRYDFKYKDLLVFFLNDDIASFHTLSDGYRGMLAIVADIAVRAVTLNPFLEDAAPAETPGVVLIDELDLHLHPRWQRQVVNDLRTIFPSIQFIATTHAQQILVGAKSGEISLLRRDSGAQKIHIRRQDIPPGLRADQVLTGEWFGLPSTVDPGTLELMERHRDLIRKNRLAQEEQKQCEQLEAELRNRLGRYADTSLERMALGVVAELIDQKKPLSAEEKNHIRERVLSRMRQHQVEQR
jgi:predicted ATP-binding protein involved in virulence